MSLANILGASMSDVVGQVYTMTIGEIVELDRPYNRAKKVRLIDEVKESKYTDMADEFIFNIPFVALRTKEFVVLPPYEVGDRVIVLFSHRDITNILENDGSESMNVNFDKSDAVIVGNVNLFDSPIDVSGSSEGEFVFKKHDNSLSIHIDKENNVEVKTDGKIYLGDKNGAEAMPLGEELKDWLDNHTHSGQGSGRPTSPSPQLSERVFNV